jgi:GTPase SAR1 family protein
MIFRNKVIIDESATFWESVSGVPNNLDELRILVCGNNGIGKSTLINKIFGAEVVRHRTFEYPNKLVTSFRQKYGKMIMVDTT